MTRLSDKIQWHPGFCGAAELELKANKNELEFEREYNLSKEPLRVDLLIVKKCADIVVENEIGRIFRKFNILEYKSPYDGMSIDDYYKAIGYACLYKGLGETVDAVPAEELTVSLFRETYPREMIKALKHSGARVEKKFPGIYYVTGNTLFATQIVVTGRLGREKHSSFRILSKYVQEEDVRRFLRESEGLRTPGDRNNIDAVLQVSISANELIYEKVKEDMHMCEALERLMKKEIDAKVEAGINAGRAEGIEKGIKQGIAKGRAEGEKVGKQDALLSSIKNLMISMKFTAEQAMNALAIPTDEQAFYRAKLGGGSSRN
jgi:hypothetical protein